LLSFEFVLKFRVRNVPCLELVQASLLRSVWKLDLARKKLAKGWCVTKKARNE